MLEAFGGFAVFLAAVVFVFIFGDYLNNKNKRGD